MSSAKVSSHGPDQTISGAEEPSSSQGLQNSTDQQPNRAVPGSPKSSLARLKLDKFGIDKILEEKHDLLTRTMPMYKKLSSVLIPPLQASLDYISPPDQNESSRDARHSDTEDDDVLFSFGDYQGNSSFLSVLATATACSGISSLRALSGFPSDQHQDGEPSHEEDQEAEPAKNQTLSSTGKTSTEVSGSSTEVADNSSTEKPEGKSSEMTKQHSENSESLPSEDQLKESLLKGERLFDSDSKAAKLQQNLYPTDVLQKILQGKDVKVPPANLRTPWENSFIDRMELHANEKHSIVLLEDDDDVSLSDKNIDVENLLLYFTARKLRETFDLDDDNVLYAHFDVWLIKDVILQGHIHVTRDAILFYSLLPGKIQYHELNDPELMIISGPLGHKIDSFFTSTHRYWAVLKSQTLSLYQSSTELYFPVKVIDLRTALYCEISKSPNVTSPIEGLRSGQASSDLPASPDSSEASSIYEDEEAEEDVKNGVWFKIVCSDKVHRFHTSSIYSARHWYNSIAKVIFQIHNTNPQREALIKIPIEDILDCHKNFVLADPDDVEPDSDDEDEVPTTISINYSLPSTTKNPSHQKFRHLSKRARGVEPYEDTVHVVAFAQGQQLNDTIERALDDHVTSNLEHSSFNRKLKQRAKRFFGDESSVRAYRKSPERIVTTVQPEAHSHMSIVEKIAEANKEIEELRREFVKHHEAGEFGSGGMARDGPWAKLMNMGNRFLPLPESNRVSEEEAAPTISYDENDEYAIAPDGDFDGGEWNYNLQFPRPFSLRDLKNLDLLLVKRRRKLSDIALQYSDLSVRAEKKIFSHHVTDDSKDNDDSPSSSSDEEDQSREPSPQDGEGGHRKKGKLHTLKKKMQTMTAVGGVFPHDPEHYALLQSDDPYYVHDSRDRVKRINHFRRHFSLGTDSKLVATYCAHLRRSMRVFGRIYLGNYHLCFRSLIPGISTKMIIPLKDVTRCDIEKGTSRFYGLIIKGKGMGEMVLDFGNLKARDDFESLLAREISNLDSANNHDDTGGDSKQPPNKESRNDAAFFDKLASTRVKAARLRTLEDRVSAAAGIEMPMILDDNPFKTTEVKAARSYRITLLTIGSRGDVQPYIALGKGLIKEGHKVTIATHIEFKDWCIEHGLNFKEIAGNPAELMQLMVTHGSMSVGFLKEANHKFRGWINELLSSSWDACKESDMLIESPSAMAGLHIAEALNIPYMRAFTMPWTRTRAYPHAFIVPDQKRGGSYNFLTHVMFENVFWKGISSQVNKWRVETLGIPKTSLSKMQQSRFPFLYNISPSMFPPAVDFPDWVKVTGYWYLDEGNSEYHPPEGLAKFMDEARANDEKIIYIGFGSIVVSDANLLTKTIVEAVLDLGVKCILNKGWSDKLNKNEGEKPVDLPPQIYDAGSIPHDWLFPRVDAAIHHGGSGTTGATLRAATPTIIKPFFGDQFFYASRIEDLGVGLALKNISKKSLTKAIKSVTTEKKYREKAEAIAKSMRHERGVSTAIEAIYSEFAYARSLMASIKSTTEDKKNNEDRSGAQTPSLDQQAMKVVGEEHLGRVDNSIHY